MHIKPTKPLHLTFSSRRSAIYKVPPRIGGHHFLLCQQTNTKDIAGQSATACHHRKFQFTYLRDPVLKQHFFKIKKHPIILQFVFFEFAIHGKLAVESTKNQQVEGSKTKKTKMAFNRTTGRSVNL